MKQLLITMESHELEALETDFPAMFSELERLYDVNSELLKALRIMVDTHSDITEGNLYSGAQKRIDAKRAARLAIAKARGEA